MILSAGGGALGVLLARAVLAALIRAYPASLPRIGEVSVDLRVMLASIAVSVVCGLLFGLASTMYPRSDATAENLKSGSRGSSGMIRRHVRRVLVIAETALAVIVVVGAGLLLRTVDNLNAVDAGFDRSHLVTFLDYPAAGHFRPPWPSPRIPEAPGAFARRSGRPYGYGDDWLTTPEPAFLVPNGDRQ